MRVRIAQIATILAATTVIAAGAQAQGVGEQGWYLGAEGGWSHLEDVHTSGSAVRTGKLRFDDGYEFGGVAGYEFANGLRLEAEIPTRSNDESRSGSIASFGVMANAIYDFLPHQVWTPYVGVGVGGERLRETGLTTASGVGLGGDNDMEFAYQGIVGVKYAVTPNWWASLDYRYLSTLNPTFNVRPGGSISTDYHTHNIVLGIVYHVPTPMAPPPEAAPAPPPPPVAAAPAPQQAQDFTVFFDFDRASLLPDARRIVQAAAHYVSNHGIARISVTGYTDTVGSQAYNLGLSKRRAETVMRYLVSQGISRSEIAESWKGKEDLRVPTPNDVREPQNRRVEILMPGGQPGM